MKYALEKTNLTDYSLGAKATEHLCKKWRVGKSGAFAQKIRVERNLPRTYCIAGERLRIFRLHIKYTKKIQNLQIKG